MILARWADAPREFGEYGARKGRPVVRCQLPNGITTSECEQNAQNREKRGLFAQLA
jgi:hypothetical protein